MPATLLNANADGIVVSIPFVEYIVQERCTDPCERIYNHNICRTVTNVSTAVQHRLFDEVKP